MSVDVLEINPVVFVVDDDPNVRESIAALVGSVGLAAETFASALDLLERVTPRDAGCIIMDVRMPTMSGLDAQRALTTHGIDLPLLFITAHADVPLAVKAMKAGAVEVFAKPYDTQTLIDSVQAAIARHRGIRQDRMELDDLRRRFDLLTDRERAVMLRVVDGYLNKQVASELGTSEKTVKTHRAHVMHKMHAASLPDLVRMVDRLRASGKVNP